MRHIAFSIALAILATQALAADGDCDVQGLGQTIGALGQRTNEMRAENGLHGLEIDAHLNRAAQRHACDLARRQVVSHRDELGRRSMSRIRRAGFRACFTAENVAQGTLTPDGTVDAWQQSVGHASNQQDPRARSMGFGVARGADGLLYWVAHYAARCDVQMAEGGKTTRVRPFSW